jgi:KaiC/GvpD/RAD55 family RecA-like ATPase
MMLEATVLKYLLHRTNFDRYYAHLEKITLEPELKRLYQLLPTFYDTSDQDTCSLNELKALFALEYPSIKGAEIYASLFEQIEEADIGDAILGTMIKKMIYKDVNNQIIQACMPVLSDSDEGDALNNVRELLDNYDNLIAPDDTNSLFVTDDLEVLLDSKVRGDGIKWRLEGLNDIIGDLRGGKLGHVFARPDTGKTTFLISEMSRWSEQLEGDDIGIWVNNEEDGEVLKLRWYSAVTGWPIAAIVSQPERAIAYYKKLSGSRVKLMDKAGITDREVKSLIKQFKPRFMVIDQGDKVKKQGVFANETARLGALYGEYREWTKMYDMDILTAGQAHADAGGKQYLKQEWMNNSKTEKPAELDYAIGIGLPQTDGDLRRYIQICKNKQGPHGHFVAMMNPQKARYTDT